jgi:hypothetical protein
MRHRTTLPVTWCVLDPAQHSASSCFAIKLTRELELLCAKEFIFFDCDTHSPARRPSAEGGLPHLAGGTTVMCVLVNEPSTMCVFVARCDWTPCDRSTAQLHAPILFLFPLHFALHLAPLPQQHSRSEEVSLAHLCRLMHSAADCRALFQTSIALLSWDSRGWQRTTRCATLCAVCGSNTRCLVLRISKYRTCHCLKFHCRALRLLRMLACRLLQPRVHCNTLSILG